MGPSPNGLSASDQGSGTGIGGLRDLLDTGTGGGHLRLTAGESAGALPHPGGPRAMWGVEGTAGSCGCFNPQAVPASDAKAADTCSQTLKAPFPTPALCLADFGGD